MIAIGIEDELGVVSRLQGGMIRTEVLLIVRKRWDFRNEVVAWVSKW